MMTTLFQLELRLQLWRGQNIISGRIPGIGEGKDLRSFVRKRIGV
jgi:hypothetical protein